MKYRFPEPLEMRHGKAVYTSMSRVATMVIKAAVSATFADLNEWVVIAGHPGIQAGVLVDNGAVRYVDEMATDDYLVTATIGTLANGKTWLLTCASSSFDRFYGVEIERGTNVNRLSILKATGQMPSPSQHIFGWLMGIITALFGWLFDDEEGSTTVPRYNVTAQTVSANDTIGIRWDQAASTIRIYRNGGAVTSLAVPRSEIPHGVGFRYFGVMQGVDKGVGVQFNLVTAQDV